MTAVGVRLSLTVLASLGCRLKKDERMFLVTSRSEPYWKRFLVPQYADIIGNCNG